MEHGSAFERPRGEEMVRHEEATRALRGDLHEYDATGPNRAPALVLGPRNPVYRDLDPTPISLMCNRSTGSPRPRVHRPS